MNTTKYKAKILIVDDIPKNIQVVANILQDRDYELFFANNGIRAIEQTENAQFDLILLDIMMPEINGFEVCQRLKNNPNTSHIPIIFLTARIDTNSIAKGFELGGQDYVTKPFNAKELTARVKTQIKIKIQKEELEELNRELEQKVRTRTVELERANKRLSILDKAKNDFLLLINHELRTPLNGIIGFSRLLESSLRSTKHAEFIKLVNISAERLNELADLALLITSLRAETYKLNTNNFSINSLIDTAINNALLKANKKNIKLVSHLPEENKISTDSILLGKCLNIIIDNAIKHSPENDTILIVYQVTENNIIIEITDNGNGFSDEALAQMFELFASEDITHHTKGLGLGLATANLIMSALSGNIEVENRNLKGAKVKLILKTI